MHAPLATKMFFLVFWVLYLTLLRLHWASWNCLYGHVFWYLEIPLLWGTGVCMPKPCRKACFLALFWGSQLFQAVICGENSLGYRDWFWRGLGEGYLLSFLLPKAATVFTFCIWLAGWPMTQCECFWGERQLMAPRRQLLIPQHAPIGCQQMCLTRELILQSIENCHVYAYTNSLCTFLFVPRCRCLPLLPFDTACTICRESCKRSTVSHPLLCVPPLR